MSPEELKRMEEAEKAEEARILAEMGDNPRERALNMMMGGRLEANVEEDLFKVPVATCICIKCRYYNLFCFSLLGYGEA